MADLQGFLAGVSLSQYHVSLTNLGVTIPVSMPPLHVPFSMIVSQQP